MRICCSLSNIKGGVFTLDRHCADDATGVCAGCVMFDKALFLVALACTAAPMLGAAVFILTLAQ